MVAPGSLGDLTWGSKHHFETWPNMGAGTLLKCGATICSDFLI